MKTAEKRAAFLIMIDYMQRQIAAMPPDDDSDAADAPIARAPDVAPPFLGRPMTAKFGGRCAVCQTAITVGAGVNAQILADCVATTGKHMTDDLK